MKVFFGCTAVEIEKFKDNYFAIRQAIIDCGHVLTKDWLHQAWERYLRKETLKDVQKVYKEVIKAMNNSDVVIVEDTVSNFSTGYEITFALQRNKPVLVLWTKEKHHPFNKTFLHGIDSPYLQISQYDKTNLHKIIETFLRKFDISQAKNRFNLVLDEVERRYLDWARFSKHKSRTDIIRSALRKEINEDEDYAHYLLND